jgi:hypothetical protein
MSFQINSDRERITGAKTSILGTDEVTVRSGSGNFETEIFRAQLDPITRLPRIGINRSGNRVESIIITSGGSGYTQQPTVNLDPPPAGGQQAFASAQFSNGVVTGILVNDSGSGYITAPGVTITGGNGVGATAESRLDTIDFELDVNGAIRTSTSIISDTARILNIDIDNVVTPDLVLKGPNFKTYMNNTGTLWLPNTNIDANEYRYYAGNVYQTLDNGTTGPQAEPPLHTDGIEINGNVRFKHIGIRVDNPDAFAYGESGDAGVFPRSITPLLGDRSDKIATTEYVLNLATNDVGGRIYVSEQIGNNANDGRSAVNPVRTIKRAAQLAWETPGVKESLIISGGNYIEDNPISLPPDCSVVGDNLRLVIIRPLNPRKHIFKFGDKNYVIGVTYRDYVDAADRSQHTWDYAMVFDDKQRMTYDATTGGDFPLSLPVGHQIFGPQTYRSTFVSNTGLTALTAGQTLIGATSSAQALSLNITFDEIDVNVADHHVSGIMDFKIIAGSFSSTDVFKYGGSGAKYYVNNTTYDLGDIVWTPDYTYQVTIAGTAPAAGAPTHSTGAVTLGTVELTFVRETYSFTSQDVISTRPEGEVVFTGEDNESLLPISRIDFSLQGTFNDGFGRPSAGIFGPEEDLGGIVFYTNQLLGFQNTHDFKEGDEIFISGIPSPEGNVLNGYQRIYKVLEDADGRSRRFVIPKKMPASEGYANTDQYDPGANASVRYASKSVTLSLLNSPNEFPVATPLARRYQDASLQIRNNLDFIADEVVGRINEEFAKFYYSVYDVSVIGGTETEFKIYLGTSRFEHNYVSGGTVTYDGNVYNISNFVWDNVTTGVATITCALISPAPAEDDTVRIDDILLNCSEGDKEYPSFSIPVSDDKCKRDIKHYLNAILRDLEFGGNYNTINAAKRYVEGTQIGLVDTEIVQTVRALEYARELAIYAMRKWRTGDDGYGSTYVKKYTQLLPYIDATVIDTDPALEPESCANVRSAIDTLAYVFVDVITNNASGTYLDAGYLIARNRDLIADEAYKRAVINYPSLALTDVQERKCRRDINYVITGLLRDLILGGNAGLVGAAESYFSGAALAGIPAGQLDATVYAFQQTRDLAIQAMRNWSDGTVDQVSPLNATYNSTTGEVTVSFVDPAVAPTTSDRVAFKKGALTFSCASNGGGNLSSPTETDRNYGKSLEITNVTSNAGVTTITCNVGDAGTAAGVAHTFVSALANGTILIYDPVVPPNSTIPQFEDWNILLYSTNPLCSNVSSTITTGMSTFEEILDGTVTPGGTTRTYGTLYDTTSVITYPEGTLYDAQGTIFTPRSDYDDYPIIEASPYTQNSSVISFLGGSGALIDGSRVKQPNCPKPGLEADGRATFPNQGKSMVASAFTIVSQGGNSTGYKITNDGYVQLVSVFCIFCSDGVLAESGGYASITNSATNFGGAALRARGYRSEAYEFDAGNGTGNAYVRATVSSMVATITNRTEVAITGLGRAPLEHYIFKIDGYEPENPDIEYFIDSIDPTSVSNSTPFAARFVLSDGTGTGPASFRDKATGTIVDPINLVDYHQANYSSIPTFSLHRPSIVNSSSHTWEFAGSGTSYNALPENGGTKVESQEQVSEEYGRVYCSGTDELGDFKVGTFAQIENRTGNITFTGTVTISEVEFLKLKGGDVVVTGFDASSTLGGPGASNTKLPTQKAVRDFITNNLGAYLNKPYSTNPIPRALVELTDSGKISEDQLPAVKPFTVYTVADQTERLAIEGALAGSIAIQQDSNASYILNNDVDSLFVSFDVDPTIQFTLGDIFTGEFRDDGATPGSGSRIQATEYRTGVLYSIVLTDPGSGYVTAPTITITGGSPGSGAVAAQASCTIAGGQVVTITIDLFNGYIGGKGYTTPPTITFSAPPGGGTSASAEALIESRLYGDIVNAIKMQETDSILSSDTPAVRIPVDRVINTSASDENNWVSLSTNSIAANDITSGVISTARLAQNSGAANSFTFLRGDSSFALAVQSIKGAETRYFGALSASSPTNSQSLVFPASGNYVIGHKLVERTGVPADTYISAVLTEGNTTTVTIDQSLTANVPAGTVLEFDRGSSPMLFDASYTQGEFIDDIVIVNGGSGYAPDLGGNNTFNGVELLPPQGVSGSGLKATIKVEGGVITTVIVTDSGSGFTQDFTCQTPAVLGAGTGLSLSAKVSTVNRQYANVSLDVARSGGEGSTISTDPYGTVGVSRFKKAQFNIGKDGNGSVELKTGIGSGLNADFLDDRDGLFYQTATNQLFGVLPRGRLDGEYDIDIRGTADDAKLINVDIGSSNVQQSPTLYISGMSAENKFNNANITGETTNYSLYAAWPEVGLNAGQAGANAGRHFLVTMRPGGSGADTTYGGLKQFAFSDDNTIGTNMYIRGTGFGVTTWKDWHKVWHSGNDSVGSGLDADRLDTKQLSWVRNVIHHNQGTLYDRRLPSFMSSKQFDEKIEVTEPLATSQNAALNGKQAYRILFDGVLLDAPEYGTVFTNGTTINLYDITGAQALGSLYIVTMTPYPDTQDPTNNYSEIVGVLVTGTTIDGSVQLGLASSNAVTKYAKWTDYALTDYNTGAGATLEVVSGTANLKLGKRVAGNSSTSPGIYFSSSATPAPNYNSAIVAGQGSDTDGSGNLNVIVGGNAAFTVNSNPVYHQGNTVFTDGIGQSTYNAQDVLTLRNAVMRDETGSFQAHKITLVSFTDDQSEVIPGELIGAASLNVLKAGDSMTGTLNILNSGGAGDPTSDLYVEGTIATLLTMDVGGNLTVGTDVLFVDESEKSVNIGTTTHVDGIKLQVNTGASAARALITGGGGNLASILSFEHQGGGGRTEVNGRWSIGFGSAESDFGSTAQTVAATEGLYFWHYDSATDTANVPLIARRDKEVIVTGKLGVAGRAGAYTLRVAGNAYVDTSIQISDNANNDGATLLFTGADGGTAGDADGLYNYRLSNQTIGDGIFAIQPNIFSGVGAGATAWDATPAIAIRGKKVAINSTSFAGVDTITTPGSNINRNYQLNVEGDVNINGDLFQDNAPFVTSRWTEATTTLTDPDGNVRDIYRLSAVGINTEPSYTFHVKGDFNIDDGIFYLNQTKVFADSNGIIKINPQQINEDVDIPANNNAFSVGPIELIGADNIITINSGAEWTIV